jgi:hypothetical protein
MAKRFCCWVIVAGAQPTAFRAKRAEDLLPTLRQLQRTQPNVALKWFDRGRFWDSPQAADEAFAARRRASAARDREWRPGGTHVDPRAKYKLTRDEKRARFKRRLISSKTGETGDGQRRPPRRPPQSRGPKRSR